MFDWVRFLSARGIDHATKGHGATRNQVVIHCPWCGASDQGLHLSINLEGAGYSCLRTKNKEHSGRAAYWLVMALLKCSPDMARSITGEKGISLTEDFGEMIARTMSGTTKQKPWREPEPPKSFKPFDTSKPSAQMYIDYMISDQRKFTIEQIANFTLLWDIWYCTNGRFKGRIIFPIYFNRELVSWTGRTVFPGITPKYLTLSTEGEPPLAKAGISNYLLWYDVLKESQWEAIIICEGPMDALKVNCLGSQDGIAATCVFTAQPSRTQIDLIHDLLPKTKRMILLLDQGTTANAMRSLQELPKEVEYMTLPKGIKDPCLLTSLNFLEN